MVYDRTVQRIRVRLDSNNSKNRLFQFVADASYTKYAIYLLTNLRRIIKYIFKRNRKYSFILVGYFSLFFIWLNEHP
ncbi:hypothetical protein HanRHA438_Chr02g0087771 [Helianthus annuus]|nr:hypothetical protein HanRHA438_Chr02g0087771 [Helianthus annuus]